MKQKQSKNSGVATFILEKKKFLLTFSYGEQQHNFWIINLSTVNFSKRSLQIVKPNGLKFQSYIIVAMNLFSRDFIFEALPFSSIKGNAVFLIHSFLY